ncbi:MAG: Rieske (2Fe-2S) protein [Acidimicrobiales bacterium]
MSDARVSAMVVHGVDELLGQKLVGVATEFGLAVGGEGENADRPGLVVINADRPDAVGEVAAWRSRVADVLIVAYLAVPHRDRWEQAERAGADLVVNKGALIRSLRRFLGTLDPGSTRRRRAPLFDAGEVAGRLGLIKAVDDTPVGPIAVYRLGSSLVAIENVCPHAGVALSEGAVEGGVLTCPGHGSQFDLGTGERVRGPADQSVRTYTVIEEGGRVWLLWV